MKSNNILNVFQTYDFQVGQLMHRALNDELPMTLTNQLTVINDLFLIKDPRLKQTEKSICFAGPKAWIHFPWDYIDEIEFNKFKTSLKQDILNKDIYQSI